MKLCFHRSRLYLLVASVGGICTSAIVAANLTDGALKQPPVLSSSNGMLDIDLSLVEGDHDTSVVASTFHTRLLGGTLPGPTLKIKRGEWLKINFKNELVEQTDTNTVMNQFSYPDSTNLHFHGAHVSGELPSDDVTFNIDPQESFQYETFFPDFHIGGTHWVHPHRHGSGTLQIGGGAAMALIVEDEPGDVPPEVESAEEVLIFVQHFDLEVMLNEVMPVSRDKLFDVVPAEGVGESFRLVNGQYKPKLEITAGEWQRWRVVFASWDKHPLDFAMETNGVCEMNLLAKDGIYIGDYPRPMNFYPIGTAGRTDIMVRCSEPGDFDITHFDGELLMSVSSKAPSNGGAIDVSSQATSGFPFKNPSYLNDLRNKSPDPGCACETLLEDDMINGMFHDPDLFVHTVALGSVVERIVKGVDSHPYHQHVYPFQLTEFFGIDDADSSYFKVGDYHDSLTVRSSEDVKIRYEANYYAGRIMLHCHRVDHADMGMLSAEDVVDPKNGGVCMCSPTNNAVGFTRPPTQAPTSKPTPNPTQKAPTPVPTPNPTPRPPKNSLKSPKKNQKKGDSHKTGKSEKKHDKKKHPTASPTPGSNNNNDNDDDPECKDDKKFKTAKKGKKTSGRGCEWVKNNPQIRCKKDGKYRSRIAAACRQSCGTCGITI